MKIGDVIDIFGPVKRPYVVIKPFSGIDAKIQVGKKLYFEER
jgi:RNA-binding protein